MTIQAWIPGEPPQQKTAQQGFLTKLAQGQVSNTVSLAAATQIPTDFIVVTTNTGACAVKLLAGQDTLGTAPGPCLPGDTVLIANHSGQNLTIYPNNALGSLKNQSAGTGYLIATGLLAILTYFGADAWALSAS